VNELVLIGNVIILVIAIFFMLWAAVSFSKVSDLLNNMSYHLGMARDRLDEVSRGMDNVEERINNISDKIEHKHNEYKGH
tara:strand:- start:197 stop:436 length:240 start_codon:yes stop_codon:yes gene_type:complete